MVTDELIEHWVKIVNAEYGLSEHNDTSIAFFKSLKNIAQFEYTDDWYFVYLISNDMWGKETMHVMSLYIMPEKRNATTILKIQHKIESIAKNNKVRYIYQGSHLNKKYNKLLKALGYKEQTFVKEI